MPDTRRAGAQKTGTGSTIEKQYINKKQGQCFGLLQEVGKGEAASSQKRHRGEKSGSWAEPGHSDREHPTGERSPDHKKTKNNQKNLRKSITKTSRLLRVAKNGRGRLEKD